MKKREKVQTSLEKKIPCPSKHTKYIIVNIMQ
jgi:hypothetical protein